MEQKYNNQLNQIIMKATYVVFGKVIVANSISEAFNKANVYKTIENQMSYNKRVNSKPIKN